MIMEVKTKAKDSAVVLSLVGKLTTTTAEKFEEALNVLFKKGEKNITVDLKDLVYLSSAGLRVFLAAQKKVDSLGGTLTVVNVNNTIMEIFSITGFTDFLKIV